MIVILITKCTGVVKLMVRHGVCSQGRPYACASADSASKFQASPEAALTAVKSVALQEPFLLHLLGLEDDIPVVIPTNITIRSL
jgi:hypothetical protein